jgi:crossover junction endodeoxyribonuclease RusA
MDFFCAGVPVAQGSKRHVGGGVMVEQLKNLQPWREALINAAHNAPSQEVFFGPVRLSVIFRFPRPKGHYGTGRNAELLKPSAPRFKTSAPDLDKLIRAVGDALTMAGTLRDDCLIVSLEAAKIYDELPGAKVVIIHA